MNRKRFGVDIGSRMIRIVTFDKDDFRIFEEKAVVAQNFCGEIVEYGNAAISLDQSAPCTVQIKKLVTISDEENSINSEGFEYMFSSVVKSQQLNGADLYLSISAALSEKEEERIVDAAQQAGVRDVFVSPVVISLKNGITEPLYESYAIIHLGAENTQVAFFSDSEIISDKFDVGGRAFTNAVSDFISDKYHVALSFEQAEKIKEEKASLLLCDPNPMKFSVVKKYIGLPKIISVFEEDLFPVVEPIAVKLINRIGQFFEEQNCSPDKIVLTGGGAMMKGIDKKTEELLNIPVCVSKPPNLSVVKGLASLAE